MNVGIIFFAYGADKDLLKLALKAVPRLRAQGHEVTAYVADDAASPLDEVPRNVRYFKTSFNRGGNLNGLECIKGMADEYAIIMTQQRHEWLIKADCDTFINHLRWLEEVDATKISIVGTIHVNKHVSGACYALSRRGAERLPWLLEQPLWQGRAERSYCEDRFFWNALRMTGGGDALARTANGQEVSELRLYHAWAYPNVSFERLQGAAAIDFKRCRWNTPPENWERDRVCALDRFKKYTDFIGV